MGFFNWKIIGLIFLAGLGFPILMLRDDVTIGDSMQSISYGMAICTFVAGVFLGGLAHWKLK